MSDGLTLYQGSSMIGLIGTAVSMTSNNYGIAFSLEVSGTYMTWQQRPSTTSAVYFPVLTYDRGTGYYQEAGLHLGVDLRTRGYNFYSAGNRSVYLSDTVIAAGTFPAWRYRSGTTTGGGIVFSSNDVAVVILGAAYSLQKIAARVTSLISSMNYYHNTGISTDISA
jgi:hypothetical protein